jgi:hypothetical protein
MAMTANLFGSVDAYGPFKNSTDQQKFYKNINCNILTKLSYMTDDAYILYDTRYDKVDAFQKPLIVKLFCCCRPDSELKMEMKNGVKAAFAWIDLEFDKDIALEVFKKYMNRESMKVGEMRAAYLRAKNLVVRARNAAMHRFALQSIIGDIESKHCGRDTVRETKIFIKR